MNNILLSNKTLDIDTIIYKKLNSYIKISKSTKVLIALSGGVDSVTLLHIISEYVIPLNLEIHAMHINYINKKNISKNFEHNARVFRYNQLYEYANKNKINIILTAHHMDDQIETLYINSLNNSDWISFVGIRDVYNKIKRPMLSISKNNILNYAKKNHLKWIEDLSNRNTRFLRNKVRLDIIPYIKDSSKITNLLEKSKKANKKYRSLIKWTNTNKNKFILTSCKDYFQFDKKIADIKDLIKFKFLFQVLLKETLNIDYITTHKNWKHIKDFILLSRVGSKFFLNKSISMMKDRDFVVVFFKSFIDNVKLKSNIVKLKINTSSIKWYNSNIAINKENKDISTINKILYSDYSRGVYLRHWRDGDKYYSRFYKKNVNVSNLFINNKISRFDKYTYPIIVDNKDNILLIPNLYQRKRINNLTYVSLDWISE